MTGAKRRYPNPLQNANALSSATFYYTLPTFTHTKRTKRQFEEDDLYETLTEHQSKMLGDKVEALWKKQFEKQKKPSLTRVLISAFGFEMFISGLLLGVAELILKPAQAVLLGRFLLYYMFTADEDVQVNHFQTRLYAGGIVLASFLQVLCLHPVVLRLKTVGLKVKIACCSLIYRKALKLNQEAFVNTSVGQIVNLIASDAPVFIMVGFMFNYLWLAPLQCIIVTYLMYEEVGLSSVFGVTVLFLLIPIHHLLSKAASKYQWKSSSRTDDRVRYMDEIILGIKIMKMYVWEKIIKTALLSMRDFEMKYIRLSMYLKSVNVSFDSLLVPVAIYVSIISYVLHNDIKPDKVFTLLIFYNSLRGAMASAFPSAINYRALAFVAIRRMEQFLLLPEVALVTIESTTDPIAIKIIDGEAKWSETSTLQKINFTVKPGDLVIVTGPVGCGKSSLLNVILKELRLISGKIRINGQISYASQDAWLFGGSIRDNILFGEQIELKRYNEVVRICALEDDFALFPLGDHELVGGRGTSLSGGQKARINLARAIYRDADIYLLDEPFAAVDAHVSRQIFQECIKRFLAKKTVVLVTHQQQYFKEADEIITMENGTVISQVPWTENDGLESFSHQDDIDRTVQEGYKLTNGAVDNKDIEKEQTSEGSVSYTVYRKYATANGFFCFAILTVLFLLTQVLLSSGPYFLTHWVNKAQIGEMSTNASHTSEVLVHSKTMHIYIYSAITFACVVTVPLRSYLFFFSVLKSSQKLHNNMFNNVIGATMHFFNTNSPGRIINRFSQDIGAVDSKLPYVLIATVQLLLEAFAAVMLISIVNYWLLLPAIIMAIISYYLKLFCLLTSRDLKRLEGVTRSPVFEHLSSSLQGLSTIRALQSETVLKEKFDAHQDLHSCSHHLFFATSQAFGYFIDCLCALYVAVVTLSFVIYDNGSLSGDVGLAITQSISLIAYLQYAMQQTAELENNMTSVERILEYDAIEQEDKCSTEPLKTWPKSGGILFRNLSLKYSPLGSTILKNLNFEIFPREKIGIIGRTGAGKSSIVNALLRLSYTSGDILIDNVDIKTLNLQAVRSKISVIPQDPTLFSGTLRQNLDPFEEYNDEVLWKSLEEVELKSFFESQPEGLFHVIVQGGTNISVGQRQLICLSRAILRNNNILIMDEATANVDLETDNLIQRTIRRKFENCTVLTIAHRLQTLLDSDRVLVMNSGEVIEFDKPSVLRENTNGYFYKVVQKMNLG
ncbi:probable multidrug resistance-associated protein lethal(2)03659 [Photinus pyralis]|uniref:probable multidrug resistance-associated protein lethal(2)03659 n=1 Tax=Photinus pyralis TaxID=7054 RepID=UPI0012673504|nr:probable multidrug resistance-associated protein lethal(2)03659 [Photinus pyralis]XP_031342699.1 probable multidrug resistance-associated protein lethal(2)03659 [Photinus pyralis]XP_031342700.1 probable multidrug resistance-associated protein lethal(2)03659 [Photinus pyralis]XP_031342701.1 probable multidrug resistance-associated protein lethal(2)03659 [Photinus pyralis]XP_031342702.1 probable multidrug resistance-associated protein lethal(2)03659 [Photinus pyralis]